MRVSYVLMLLLYFEILNQCSRRENNTTGLLYFTEIFLMSLQPAGQHAFEGCRDEGFVL